MADNLTKEKRSWNMSHIRSRHTKPELIIRSLLHRAGYRFRINYSKLPGSPDIVLPKYKIVIFVHGCFWHRHKNCKRATMPSTKKKYWQQKFNNTIARDNTVQKELKALKWKVIIVWECNILKNPTSVFNALIQKLQRNKKDTYTIQMSRKEILHAAEKKSMYYIHKSQKP